MQNEKPIAVYGALASNLVIAIFKFIVAAITGSSAMVAEAIHSTADTGNELFCCWVCTAVKSHRMKNIPLVTDVNFISGV